MGTRPSGRRRFRGAGRRRRRGSVPRCGRLRRGGELDLAGGEAARADGDAPGQADQIDVGELGAGALVAVVIERVDAGGGQRGVEPVAGGVGGGVALAGG